MESSQLSNTIKLSVDVCRMLQLVCVTGLIFHTNTHKTHTIIHKHTQTYTNTRKRRKTDGREGMLSAQLKLGRKSELGNHDNPTHHALPPTHTHSQMYHTKMCVCVITVVCADNRLTIN